VALPPIPARPRRLVIRELMAILRENARLNIVAAWRDWSGEEDDGLPGSDNLPWVRMTPVLNDVKFYDPTARDGDVGVLVETFVGGTNFDDILDLWGEIEATFSLNDNALRARLVALGAETGEVVVTPPKFNGVKEGKEDTPTVSLSGTGLLRTNVVQRADT
jgi:hypothetical protein